MVHDTLYQLSLNRPPHQLHGGIKGFDKQVWQAQTEPRRDGVALHLTLTSPDGDEGYPGTLVVKVSYIVKAVGELVIEYRATTDKDTIFNPTQHSYFNLSGDATSDVLTQQLIVNADEILELDASAIPTGNFMPVRNTPFDFRQKKLIGTEIKASNPHITHARGYDHYYIGQQQRGEVIEIAQLYDETSGRLMRVSTTERGAQVYTANYLNSSVIVKGGVKSKPHHGICIETGQLPNAAAEALFDSVILTAENPFYSMTKFTFSTVKPTTN